MIRDEDLLLYHYGEGLDPVQRAHIAAELRSDVTLMPRLRQMLADLEAVGSQSQTAAPAATRARLAAHLQAAAAAEARSAHSGRSWQGGWGVVLAACAALGVGLLIGRNMQVPVSQSRVTTNPHSAPVSGNGFERGLRLHLAKTEQMLVGIEGADAATRASLLGQVIEQNRLFALAAERADEERLARVLRSFDALLQEMAEETTASGSLQSNSDRLGFELAVMQTKLAQAPSKSTLQL